MSARRMLPESGAPIRRVAEFHMDMVVKHISSQRQKYNMSTPESIFSKIFLLQKEP